MPQPTVLAASLLALAVIGWGFAQSLPGLLSAWQHPVWEQTRELLQLPELAGALALVPERSAQVATHYLTYLLNGLFIEQHAQSLDNRRGFTDWVAAQSPRRVADYGGGFGGLARMIGAACPSAEVEVIEPHPHPLAIERARRSPNVHYRPALDGEYDILIATDVFEHVPDPLGLAAETAAALKPGGHYLIANCFQPVILCHLPQTFHFRHSWDRALRALGLEPTEAVVYGRAFQRRGGLNLEAARAIEHRSRRLWPLTRPLPGRIARPLTKALLN
ncbi:hypothetical protein CKO42_21715 [Lamprobacter modestohalophilus]|uniref:Class I SAM-dependent methyltransferase n=2 Tax=Lamprobacter modestohalophilus TaxID=1064514 RepID=A0A9X0WCN8_9GAMM|nr:hypothetical protein [Lamprobacter modestohalophilus]